MDHGDGGERSVADRLDQLAAHSAGIAARRIVFDIAYGHPLVGERDRLRLGVARQHRLRLRQRRAAADQGHRRGAAEELAAVHRRVAVFRRGGGPIPPPQPLALRRGGRPWG